MRRGVGTLAAIFVVVALSIAGCSSDGGSSGDQGSGASKADAGAAGGSEAAAETAGPKGRAVEDREIVYTADLTVRVADAERASDAATRIAEQAGGYLAAQKADLAGQRTSTITLRIPADRFRATVDDVVALGRVSDRQIDSTDVTDEVVDVTGRLKSTRTSADRLRTLLAAAPSTADIVTIEQELAKRESEIETLEGRLRVLDDQTTLATVTARFTEKAPPAPEPDDELPGFVSAVKAGGRAVVGAAQVVLLVIGFLLPFLPVVIALVFGFRWWRRRHPKVRPEPIPPWTPPVAPYRAAPGDPGGRPAPPTAAPAPAPPEATDTPT